MSILKEDEYRIMTEDERKALKVGDRVGHEKEKNSRDIVTATVKGFDGNRDTIILEFDNRIPRGGDNKSHTLGLCKPGHGWACTRNCKGLYAIVKEPEAKPKRAPRKKTAAPIPDDAVGQTIIEQEETIASLAACLDDVIRSKMFTDHAGDVTNPKTWPNCPCCKAIDNAYELLKKLDYPTPNLPWDKAKDEA